MLTRGVSHMMPRFFVLWNSFMLGYRNNKQSRRGIIFCVWLTCMLWCCGANSLKSEATMKDNNFGLVKVALANVMRLPDWRDERVTQARLGEKLEITAQKGLWYKVRVCDQERDDQGYVGWVTKSSVAVGEFIPDGQCVRVKTVRGHILGKPQRGEKPVMVVYANSYLHPLREEGEWLALKLPGQKREYWIHQSEVLPDLLEPQGQSLIAEAKRFLGTPYLWGGMSVLGIDCSGFTYTVYERHGLLLPRDADEQYQCGSEVDADELRGGDLLFFGRPGRVTHVGMYISGGLFIHASSSRGVSIMSLRESERVRCYLGARRIIE